MESIPVVLSAEVRSECIEARTKGRGNSFSFLLIFGFGREEEEDYDDGFHDYSTFFQYYLL